MCLLIYVLIIEKICLFNSKNDIIVKMLIQIRSMLDMRETLIIWND